MASSKARKAFSELLAAYKQEDEEKIEQLKERLITSGKTLAVKVQDDVDWHESNVDGFAEYPVVNQQFTVSLGDEPVYEGERSFGSELEDPTHTGLGGHWTTIRIDDEESGVAERLLEDFGVEMEWPKVPPWRR